MTKESTRQKNPSPNNKKYNEVNLKNLLTNFTAIFAKHLRSSQGLPTLLLSSFMAKRFVHICSLLLVLAGMLPIYGQSFDWLNITTDSPRPSARSGHGMVYDPIHAKVVLFGGADSTGTLNDVWEFDTATRHWTNVTPLSGPTPVPRSDFGIALDENRGVIVIYGGNCGANCVEYGNVAIVGDTWEWNTTTKTWRKGPSTIPVFVGLQGSALAYDPTRRQVIAFAGRPYWCSYCTNNTWAWNGTSWTDITPAISPDGRFDHAMSTDTDRNRIVMFGPFEDTWEWDGSKWIAVGLTGPHPTWRFGVRMAYDKIRHKTILFGGSNQYTAFNETWEWDGTTWTQLAPLNSPPGRGYTSLVYDESQNVLMMFSGGGQPDDTWISGSSNTVSSNGLVAWYKADGNTIDSARNHNGITHDNLTFVPGKYGQAFRRDYVSVENAPDLETQTFSVSFWVRSLSVGSPGPYNYILAKGNDGCWSASYSFSTEGEGGLRMRLYDGSNQAHSPDAGTAIWDGNWHNVVGTYDGSYVRLYVDGNQIGNGTPSSININFNLPTSRKLLIGAFSESTACRAAFNGDVDDIKIYNRALSSSEISSEATGLVAWYKEDGNANDSVGNHNPSATNATSFVNGKIGQGASIARGGYIEIPDSADLKNQQFTVSVWARPDGPGSNVDFMGASLVQKGVSQYSNGSAPNGDYYTSLGIWWTPIDSGRFKTAIGDVRDNAITSAHSFPIGEFHRVTSTYDGTKLRLYVDCQLEAEKTISLNIQYDPAVPWTIGSASQDYRNSGYARNFDGVIDEVKIWNGALTEDEVRSIDNAANCFSCTNKVIASFDATRGGNYSLQYGSQLSQARSLLANNFPEVTLRSISTLTDANLNGVNVLLISSAFGNTSAITPLSTAEQATLRSFVESGGSVYLLPDNKDFNPAAPAANNSLVAAFGMGIDYDVPLQGTGIVINPASNQITNGRFGTVSSFARFYGGLISNLGPIAVSLAYDQQYSSLGSALAVIPPNALLSGSGKVVISPDVDTIGDNITLPASNQILFLNIIDYLLNDVRCAPTDAVAPVTTISQNPNANGAGWNNSDVTLTLSATDDSGGSGVKEIIYSANGAQTLPSTSINGTSANLTISAEGTTTVTYFARDNAGNTEAVQSITIRIDKTAPVISNLPSNQTIEATSANGATVSWSSPTVGDNLDPNVSVACSPVSGSVFAIGTTVVQCSSTDRAGNSSSMSFNVIVADTTVPTLANVPADFTIEATGANGALVSYTAPTANDAVDGNLTVNCTPASGTVFSIGSTQVTCTATDAHNNVAQASFNVSVQDSTPPVISNMPSNISVFATSAAGAQITFTQPTAVDTVEGSIAVSCSPSSGSIFAHGTTPVVCTAKDSRNNKASQSFTVEVKNAPPTANAGGPYQVGEGGTVSLSGSGADIEGSVLTYEWDLDNNGSFETTGQNPMFSAVGLDGPTSRNVKLRVTDAAGLSAVSMASVNVLNVAPTLNSVTGPTAPQPVNTTVTLSLNYNDPAGSLDTYTVITNWGDGTIDNSTSHVYTAAGVYRVKATVSDDDDGISNEAVYEYVVIYDPNGGFVTGGGWITSPAGAYIPNPSLTGKASFGFVAKYQKGANVPSGNTEFQFHAANFNLKSDSYEWLVVAGAKAQFKGTGSVNGVSGYSFMLTATDGQVNGGGGADKFRIKIWNAGGVVYDNISGGADDANPQEIGGGSIVIRSDR